MRRIVLLLSAILLPSCSPTIDKHAPASPASVVCQTNCVSVTPAFVKEHADLFDEVIRLRAALKVCQEALK